MVDLLEDNDTGKKFALKRIQCHSREDERLAKEEAEYHPKVNHPNLIPLEAWKVTRGTGGVTEVLIVLPFFRVSVDFLFRVDVAKTNKSGSNLLRPFYCSLHD